MSWQLDSSVERLFDLKRQMLNRGDDLIDLSMINPDVPPPRMLQDRLLEAINKPGSYRYSSSRGVKRLREGFCQRYLNRFQVQLDPECEVCVTLGTKDGILHALSAISKMDTSQKVLVGSPTYPAYGYLANYLDLEVAEFDLSKGWNLALEELDELAGTSNCKTLLLNFPHNPTGWTLSRDNLDQLAKIVTKHGLYVVNDFTYGELVYDQNPAVSILSHPILRERCLEAYGLSKSFSVPGWRVGAVIGAKDLISEIARLKSRVDFGTFLPIQFAAVSALLSDDEVVNFFAELYSRRYRFFSNEISQLSTVNLKNSHYDGAIAGCSAWIGLPEDSFSGDKLAELALENGVVILPGSAFGKQWSNYFRIALVAPEPQLREVANVIGAILNGENSKIIKDQLSVGCY